MWITPTAYYQYLIWLLPDLSGLFSAARNVECFSEISQLISSDSKISANIKFAPSRWMALGFKECPHLLSASNDGAHS